MPILVISSVAPRRCGIAAYARQQVAALRAAGQRVELASLDGPGEADFCFDLNKVADLQALARLSSGYQRCILHYQHDFFFQGLAKRQLLIHNLALAQLFARGMEVVAHELLYPLLDGRAGHWVGISERFKWRQAKKIWVHTPGEATRLKAALASDGPAVPGLPALETPPIAVRQHHADFQKFGAVDQRAARRELGLPERAHLFLCIGFLEEHKGFDRAMRAFCELADPAAELYVVGSARVAHPEILAHVAELRQLARRLPRVTLIERFVSDADFDLWISAADVLVLPYREIWSSGVLGRARLYDKQVVAAAVGGLPAQLGPRDIAVDAGASLADALAATLPKPGRGRSRPGALRLGVVVPWYGEGVWGGAEQVVREGVQRLARAGMRVEVFTTQLQGYVSDWSVNARPFAHEEVYGIPVHRAPVLPRDAGRFAPLAAKVSRGGQLDGQEQRDFFAEMIRCPALPALLRAERDRFDLFLLGNYMFTPTLEAAQALGDRALILPFLHDEGYARLPPYAAAYRGLRGALFNSAAEAELAPRLWGLDPARCRVVGNGVDAPPPVSPLAFARRHRLGRYLVYVGRQEEGKNFPLLIELFRAYRRQGGKLQLALIGAGQFRPSAADADSIGVYGRVSETEKYQALRGAVALVQPSVLESFSLSILESWNVGRPALVHAACAVTRQHSQASGGGLWFHDAASFAAAVEKLDGDPRLAARLGRRGRLYVQRDFRWPAVMERWIEALEHFRALGAGSRSAA